MGFIFQMDFSQYRHRQGEQQSHEDYRRHDGVGIDPTGTRIHILYFVVVILNNSGVLVMLGTCTLLHDFEHTNLCLASQYSKHLLQHLLQSAYYKVQIYVPLS